MARYRGSLWWIGGMPSPESAGGSGDMLMAANADQVLTAAEQQLALMTGHHAYRTWQRLNPEEAAAHPIAIATTTLVDRDDPPLPHETRGQGPTEPAAVRGGRLLLWQAQSARRRAGRRAFNQTGQCHEHEQGHCSRAVPVPENRTGKKGQ